jgi:hypothetical protein
MRATRAKREDLVTAADEHYAIIVDVADQHFTIRQTLDRHSAREIGAFRLG